MANAANTSASTLEKCKALLQEAVTELNSSSSNSEESASTPAVTGTGSGLRASAFLWVSVSWWWPWSVQSVQQRRPTATKCDKLEIDQ